MINFAQSKNQGKGNHMLKMRNRDALIITVTLIVHSPKYSNRKITKKTVQLKSIQPIGGSAREFSKNVVTK